MNEKKDSFGSKIGFILAAAGSAVGLGNIWRFPYLAAKYGGGLFLIVYLILACTFGFALMTTEIALGRRTGKSVIGAYKSADKRFGFLGPLATLVPFIITPYYCAIGGWVIKYFLIFIEGGESITEATSDTFFETYIGSNTSPMIFFGIFVILTAGVVIFGVKNGIEKISKILMPALIVLTIGIAVYTLTRDGAGEGLRYYLLPNFSEISGTMLLKTVAAATSQLFYSMSLAMGIMVTYGSYMRKEDSIEKSVRQIEIFDTGIALLAGLIIVPAVFIFSNGDASALNAGPGLMFITLPKVFNSMEGGNFIGMAFFLLVILAALTSAISLFETQVSILCEKFHLSRVSSTIINFLIVLALGSLSVLGYGCMGDVTLFGMQFLDFFDFISNSVLMPIVALITCIFIGYFIKTSYIEDEVRCDGKKFAAKGLYRVMVKYVCPVFLVIILVTALFVTL